MLEVGMEYDINEWKKNVERIKDYGRMVEEWPRNK